MVEEKCFPLLGRSYCEMNSYCLAVLSLALIYGAVLSQVPTEQFKDFSNYLDYAALSLPRLLDLLDRGMLPALANEPVWLLINTVLGAIFPEDSVVRLIIFVTATLTAWLVLTSQPRHLIWLMVFLLLPVVVKNHLIHLRQGLAIAVFLWGWVSQGRFSRWLLMCLAPFVHASFFFVLGILWASKAMRYLRIGPDIRTIVFASMGVFTGLGLGWFASALGARQVETYAFSLPQVSGLGFLMWFSILGLWMLEGKKFLKAHVFEAGLIVFYLSTYWLIEVTARIFESGVLLVLMAGLALSGWRRLGFLAMIVVFGGVMWSMRIGKPAMGFGVG